MPTKEDWVVRLIDANVLLENLVQEWNQTFRVLLTKKWTPSIRSIDENIKILELIERVIDSAPTVETTDEDYALRVVRDVEIRIENTNLQIEEFRKDIEQLKKTACAENAENVYNIAHFEERIATREKRLELLNGILGLKAYNERLFIKADAETD